MRRRSQQRGFTLIELMVVIAIMIILLSLAMPRYQKSILHAQETALKEDLYSMRSVIDQYTLDKQKAPQSLQDLVDAGYLKQLPMDPFTRSRDTWVPGFGGLGAHTILIDGKNPDRMWAGVSAAGFFRSDDGGKTWAPKNKGVNPAIDIEVATTGQCVHHVAHDPQNAGLMFRQEHRGVHKSEDGGDTWRVMEDGLPVAELSDGHRCSFGFPLVVDIASGKPFVVPLDGDNFRFPRGGQLAVYRSDDGERWQRLTNGLPDNCYTSVLRGSMAADQRSGVYFGTASGTIYGSPDLGENWAQVATGLPRILSVEAYAS